ncbi:hypothetical protein F4802DRAFT_568818 [Xylaria palmicola]|nr:hypothetical protein F4802DRAFT_568818 [Xylaria palmicola]
MTISAGNMAAHVYCAGFNPETDPSDWYNNLHTTHIKWEDRATSSNASTVSRSPSDRGSPGGRHHGQAGGSSHTGTSSRAGRSSHTGASSHATASSEGRWVLTGSGVPGQQYQWWDGTKYTNNFA